MIEIFQEVLIAKKWQKIYDNFCFHYGYIAGVPLDKKKVRGAFYHLNKVYRSLNDKDIIVDNNQIEIIIKRLFK